MNLFKSSSLLLCATLLAVISLGQSTVMEISIAQGIDDVEQEGEFVSLQDLELDLGWQDGEESKIGLLFRNVGIRSTSDVDSAWLSLVLQSDVTDSLVVEILLESDAFPERYYDSLGIDEGRNYLGSNVTWTIPPTTMGTAIVSPDLSGLIEEATAIGEWGPTSGLNFLIRPSQPAIDSGRFEAEFYSFDQSNASYRPKLSIALDSAFINVGIPFIQSQEVVVYPNPSSGPFTLTSSERIEDVIICDLHGEIIYRNTGFGKHAVMIDHLAPGAYLVHARLGNSWSSSRLIVAPTSR